MSLTQTRATVDGAVPRLDAQTPPQMVSVVIAAHNEEAVLGACLDSLRSQPGAERMQIVVSANGCTDGTAEVAYSRGAQVVDRREAGKPAALNAAEKVAVGFPRIYLDADIVVPPGAVDAVLARLSDSPRTRAVVPRRRVSTAGRPWPVKGYFAIQQRLPVFRDGLFGRGMIAVSAEGRARFDEFPDLIADDLFLDSQFSAEEKAEAADAEVIVEAPYTTRALLRRLVRVRRGNSQMRAASQTGDIEASVRSSDPAAWLRDVVMAKPVLIFAAVPYVTITVIAALLARRPAKPAQAWGRDESTRVRQASVTDQTTRMWRAWGRIKESMMSKRTRNSSSTASPHVLIIVQNLPVPLDRRVWLECQALITRGYRVSVICPKGPGDAAFEHLDGVDIFKYAPAPEAKGLAGFAWEFAYSWLRTARLSVRVWRRGRFDVLQACNPPDTYWLLALLWRAFGVKFVFDHHDLNPELFRSRFGEPDGLLKRLEYKALTWLERRSFRGADHIISTNESYKAVAVARGDRLPDDVTVVRSGPDTEQMRPIFPDEPHSADVVNLVYIGIMGPQDGVDQLLLVVDELVHNRGRTHVTATLMGFGDCLESLKEQSTALGLDAHVTFTGRVDRIQMAEYLSRADIGLCPDLKTPLNDLSTMNKTMEYMAYALPAVAFDLAETRISGADAVLYAPSGDLAAFTDQVERLIDDPARRVGLGRAARSRVAEVLDWRPQAEAYVGVYDALTGHHQPGPAVPMSGSVATSDAQGRAYVDLDNPVEFENYIISRKNAAPVPVSAAGIAPTGHDLELAFEAELDSLNKADSTLTARAREAVNAV